MTPAMTEGLLTQSSKERKKRIFKNQQVTGFLQYYKVREKFNQQRETSY